MSETILKNSINEKVLSILIGVIAIVGIIMLIEKIIAPKLKLSSKLEFYGLAFVSIPFIYFIIVIIMPMIKAFAYSFQKYNILSPQKNFIGLENYQYILNYDLFWIALTNSLKFALFRVPLSMLLSLITALMLQVVKKGKNIIQPIILLPFMTSGVILGWIFKYIYSREGPVFFLLTALGLSEIKSQLLLNVNTALYSIGFVSAWSAIPFYTLLFIVGLQAIPEEIYDAAKVDGANNWRILTKITIPLLNPTLVLVAILAVTASLKNFDLIRVMSGNNGTGGPMNSTLTMPLLIYMEAFTRLNMGRAATITVIFFAIIMIITLLQLKFTQKPVEY